MTCIVAIADKGVITMGADSAGVGGNYNLMTRTDRKMFVRQGFVIGYTTSFRMGQLLQFKLNVPQRHPSTDLLEFMCTEFIDAVRRTLADGGFKKTESGVERGGNFLVGHAGRLFEIGDDFQIAEPALPFWSVGCAFDAALGSLHTSARIEGATVRARISAALEAAHALSAGVRPPFHIEDLA